VGLFGGGGGGLLVPGRVRCCSPPSKVEVRLRAKLDFSAIAPSSGRGVPISRGTVGPSQVTGTLPLTSLHRNFFLGTGAHRMETPRQRLKPVPRDIPLEFPPAAPTCIVYDIERNGPPRDSPQGDRDLWMFPIPLRAPVLIKQAGFLCIHEDKFYVLSGSFLPIIHLREPTSFPLSPRPRRPRDPEVGTPND